MKREQDELSLPSPWTISGLLAKLRYNWAIMKNHTFAVIAFEGISPFHLSVPCAVFRPDPADRKLPPFEIRVCAAEASPMLTSAEFSIHTPYTLDDLDWAQTIIVPSWRNTEELPPESLLEALRKAHGRGARIVGLCLGAFVLAAAGLLDDRPASTHWNWTDELAQRYPRIKVKPKVLYVDDHDIMTSAGSAASIDCCLHLLRTQYGAEVANHVARRMVVPPHREGGQAQYIEQTVFNAASPDRLSITMECVSRNLGINHTLDSMAERALMSRRTFTRRFRKITGMTVRQWLLNQRLALAQILLETSKQTIENIADASGFATPSLFRRHFRRAFGITPSAWRRMFCGD